jgi:hypothetical protein
MQSPRYQIYILFFSEEMTGTTQASGLGKEQWKRIENDGWIRGTQWGKKRHIGGTA